MKGVRSLLPFFLFITIIFGNASLVNAQEPPTEKELAIKNLVDSQQYVFHAQSANPSGGRTRQLTSEYFVLVTRDTILSELPYFGRAYSANIGSSDGGIQFTSVDFVYKAEPRKKGGWEVAINPRDVTGAKQFFMTIFENGTATLRVNSNTRQSISFNGYIEARKSGR